MPFAGVVTEVIPAGPQVLQSLARLSFSPVASPSLLEGKGATLGCTEDGVLHSGHGDASGLLLAMDGTLYESDAVASALAIPADSAAGEIILHSYLRWGDEFPDRLDGEYAFALWDGRRQRLLLGRDAMGRVPLHYAQTASGFCFCTEPRGLVGWPGVDVRLDEVMLARSLSLQPERGLTMYRGIRSALMGQVLVVEAGKPPKAVRYWQPTRLPQLRLKDPRHYSEALRAAMERAVAIRVPQEGLIGSNLSSGFDSSSVTALLARVLLKQNRPLVAYTSAPAHQVRGRLPSHRFADEWPLAAKVAAMYPNIEHVRIRTDHVDWWESLDVMADGCGEPVAMIRNSRWFYAILADGGRRGLHSMFEGHSGNLTGSYDGALGLYDLRKRGRWISLIRAAWLRHGNGETWKNLVHQVWQPDNETLSRIRRLGGRKTPGFFEQTMMRPEFYAASGLPAHRVSAAGGLLEGDRRNGAEWRLSLLRRIDTAMTGAAYKRLFGVHRQDPTADRRLVELCLSIPDEDFAPRGVPRQLYRDAMQDVLPAELLAEPLRGLQSGDFLEMFDMWTEEFRGEVECVANSPLASRVLDADKMRALLNAWPGDAFGERSSSDLMYSYVFGGAMALGRFLRQSAWEEHR